MRIFLFFGVTWKKNEKENSRDVGDLKIHDAHWDHCHVYASTPIRGQYLLWYSISLIEHLHSFNIPTIIVIQILSLNYVTELCV